VRPTAEPEAEEPQACPDAKPDPTVEPDATPDPFAEPKAQITTAQVPWVMYKGETAVEIQPSTLASAPPVPVHSAMPGMAEEPIVLFETPLLDADPVAIGMQLPKPDFVGELEWERTPAADCSDPQRHILQIKSLGIPLASALRCTRPA
jgi:hypothetical protein